MRIEISPIRATVDDKSLHLRISTPDGDCYNFRVPEAENGKRNECAYEYSYTCMKDLHKMLDKFINRAI
jgi:hypothetical protein